jgi:hypothetical protein
MKELRLSRHACGLIILLFAAVAGLPYCTGSATARAKVWVAMGPGHLLAEIQPLADLRRSQGFAVEVIANGDVASVLSTRTTGLPDYLLLVGDDDWQQTTAPWNVRSFHCPLYRWANRQPRSFASDLAFADRDKDGLPDFPVGRIPARNPRSVTQAVNKILEYERSRFTEADLSLPMWGGSPGYGPLLDSLATTAFVTSVNIYGPAWSRPRLLSADPAHLLCGVPEEQEKVFLQSIRQGGCFAFIMGHGSRHEFSPWIQWPQDAGEPPMFVATDAAEALAAGPPAPPLTIYTCSSGDFAGPDDCLAESLFRMLGGPVAVIGASTESHPMTNAFSIKSHFGMLSKGATRLGDLWLRAQREARSARDYMIETTLLNVEGSLDGEIDQVKLRRDQVFMYNILGDPALRLKLPDPMTVEVAPRADGWAWKAAPPPGTKSVRATIRSDRKLVPRKEIASPPKTASAGHGSDTTTSVARAGYKQFDSTFEFESLPLLDGFTESLSAGFVPAAVGPGLLRLIATDNSGIIAVGTARLD